MINVILAHASPETFSAGVCFGLIVGIGIGIGYAASKFVVEYVRNRK